MSSRNMLLNPDERKVAKEISKTLFEALDKQRSITVPELKKWVIDTLNAYPPFQVEYFEIVFANNLKPILRWEDEGEKIGCIAIKLGKIRLIDNIYFA
jgi:pantoate--beta-alanine ligase